MTLEGFPKTSKEGETSQEKITELNAEYEASRNNLLAIKEELAKHGLTPDIKEKVMDKFNKAGRLLRTALLFSAIEMGEVMAKTDLPNRATSALNQIMSDPDVSYNAILGAIGLGVAAIGAWKLKKKEEKLLV